MSSVTCPKEDEIQDISGRVASLEGQHRSMLDMQAETLAEIRAMREDFVRHSESVAFELQRVYRAIKILEQ